MIHFMHMQMHIIYLCKGTCAFFNFLYLTHPGVMYHHLWGVCMSLHLSITYSSPQSAAFLLSFFNVQP